MFRKACAGAGVVSDLEIAGDENFQLQTGVLCRNDDPALDKVCFLINFCDRELACRVKLPPFSSCREVLSGKEVAENELELVFRPYGTKVFDCRAPKSR